MKAVIVQILVLLILPTALALENGGFEITQNSNLNNRTNPSWLNIPSDWYLTLGYPPFNKDQAEWVSYVTTEDYYEGLKSLKALAAQTGQVIQYLGDLPNDKYYVFSFYFKIPVHSSGLQGAAEINVVDQNYAVVSLGFNTTEIECYFNENDFKLDDKRCYLVENVSDGWNKVFIEFKNSDNSTSEPLKINGVIKDAAISLAPDSTDVFFDSVSFIESTEPFIEKKTKENSIDLIILGVIIFLVFAVAIIIIFLRSRKKPKEENYTVKDSENSPVPDFQKTN